MLSVPPLSQTAYPTWGALVFIFCQLVAILGLVLSLFLPVSSSGGGGPCAGLAWLFNTGKFTLQVLDLVLLLFDEVHEALIARGERGVV